MVFVDAAELSTLHSMQLDEHGLIHADAHVIAMRGCRARSPAATAVPVFLYLPAESIEERGARFERWLSRAYPQAVDAWRAWA